MTRVAPATLLLLLLLLATATAEPSGARRIEVHPSLDVGAFIVYRGGGGVAAVHPRTFRIVYTAEYDAVVNAWWCPAWWDPACNPENYRYRVTSKSYEYLEAPPQVVEAGGARILLTYFTTVSAVPYASRSWWGWFEEHVRVHLSVYVYGRVDRPPSEPGRLELGRLIAGEVAGDSLHLDFAVEVERVEPEPRGYRVTGSFKLLLEPLQLSFYELAVAGAEPVVYGVRGLGDLEEEGYIAVAPVGALHLDLCLLGEPGYRLEGTLSYRGRYGSAESRVTLESGGCTTVALEDVVLEPGNHTGAGALTVTFRAGAFTLNLAVEAEVTGRLAAASKPLVLVYYMDGWRVRVYAGVDYEAYGVNPPVYVSASGEVSVQGATWGFECPVAEFKSGGVYECEVAPQWGGGVEPAGVGDAVATVTLALYDPAYGVTVYDTVTVNCTVVAPTRAGGVAAAAYTLASTLTLALATGLAILHLVNYVATFIAGRPLTNPYHTGQGLLFSTLLSVVVYVAPYLYWLVAHLLHSIPEFRGVLAVSPLADPDSILSMPPGHAVAVLMSFYDLTLTSLRVDYELWFEGQMVVHVLPRLVAASAVVATLIAVSLILVVLGGSTGAGTVLVPLVSFLSMVIGVFVMMTPMAGVVQALVSLAEFTVTAVAVLAMALLVAGVAVSLLPSRAMEELGTSMLGAGLLYILSVPPAAPVVYCLYRCILSSIDYYVSLVEDYTTLELWVLGVPVDIIVPVAPLMRMSSYIAVATLTSAMIALVQALTLAKAGAVRGLGEALLRIARRP